MLISIQQEYLKEVCWIMSEYDVIYLSGGKGLRLNLGYPKQFARINGKPIIIYGLETLNQLKEINNIIIPCNQDCVNTINKMCIDYNITKNIIYVPAGKTRQESVYNSITVENFVLTKYILICEAVRPFMSVELIKKVLEIDKNVVVPLKYSMASVLDIYGEYYDRSEIGEVMMPQKFLTSLLIDCHNQSKEDDTTFTDDASLVIEYSDYKPYIIWGEEKNIKITTPLDLVIAEAIAKMEVIE